MIDSIGGTALCIRLSCYYVNILFFIPEGCIALDAVEVLPGVVPNREWVWCFCGEGFCFCTEPYMAETLFFLLFLPFNNKKEIKKIKERDPVTK